MEPGMNHCQGGDGPDTFDMLGALEQWVEQGNAPDRIRGVSNAGRQGGPDASVVSVSAGCGLSTERGVQMMLRTSRVKSGSFESCW